MPITIGANIFSLRTQRALSSATSTLSQSFERLSSGQRINRAVDDAAGLAVADKLRVDSQTYTTALRNIGDGTSALQIMTSSLDSQLGIIQRLQELAEQAANGTLSSSQRRTLQKEYSSLSRELGRVGDTASFNNINLLLGGRNSSNPSSLNLQIGINGSVNSALSFSLSDSGSISGIVYTNAIADVPSYSPGSTYAYDNISGGRYRTSVVDSNGVSREILISFDAAAGATGASFFIRGDQSNGAASSSADVWVAAGQVYGSYDEATGKMTAATAVASLNMTGFANGGSATASIDLSGLRMQATNLDAENYSVAEFTAIETIESSKNALTVLGRRQEQLQSLVGTYGAVMSRLQSAHSVVSVARENSKAAESRIRDVDVAQESAELVRTQIVQQAATAILAQANQQPQLALSLLQQRN